jgi:hypothetical protein
MKKKRANYDCNYKLWRRKLGDALLQDKHKFPPRSDKLVAMEGISVMVLVMKLLILAHIVR